MLTLWRLGLALFFYLLMASCGACAAPSPVIPRLGTPGRVVDHVNESTVVLYTFEEDFQSAASCTGVWVSKTHILTAKHCVRAQLKPGAIPLAFYTVYSDFDGKLYPDPAKPRPARVIAGDPVDDLALLVALNPPPHKHVTISKFSPRSGMSVFSVGHTASRFQYNYVPGAVSQIRYDIEDGGLAKVIHVTSAVWFGNSGGGLYDNDGGLLGICASIVPSVPLASFFVHKSEIVAFLKEQKVPM